MVIKSGLTPNRIFQFKGEMNDENRLISGALRAMLPPAGIGIVLDVGAGLGDIAAAAFPDRKAVLIDILEFSRTSCPLHARETIDFFDWQPGSEQVDLMLMSHVLQYLDDDLERLVGKIMSIAPTHIAIVANRPTKLHFRILEWFAARGITQNSEQFFRNCGLIGYSPAASSSISSTLRCASVRELARQLTSMIYDVDLDRSSLNDFADWLGHRISGGEIAIPQTLTLMTRMQDHA